MASKLDNLPPSQDGEDPQLHANKKINNEKSNPENRSIQLEPASDELQIQFVNENLLKQFEVDLPEPRKPSNL